MMNNCLCKICNKTFSTPQGLRTHTHTVHVLKLFDHSKIFTVLFVNENLTRKMHINNIA